MEKTIEENKQGESLLLEQKPQNTKKLFIESYGCAMNFSDSEIVASILSENGFNTTQILEEADFECFPEEREPLLTVVVAGGGRGRYAVVRPRALAPAPALDAPIRWWLHHGHRLGARRGLACSGGPG